jgi:hypothetical protein
MNDYIDPVLADEARELMEDCRNNTMLFCKMIMPGRFNFPCSAPRLWQDLYRPWLLYEADLL